MNQDVNRIYYWNWGKKEKIKHILGMGSSSAENYNNNDFYSYLQKSDLTYSYYISQTPKGASNMQRIAQILGSIKKLETVINIKVNFRCF